MKRPAFTLLETVIALVVAAIVMGAALTASRAIQRNARLSEVKAEQDTILNDTIEQLLLTQETVLQSGGKLSDAFSTITPGTRAYIAPYRIRTSPVLATTDPIALSWCTPTAACASLISYAGLHTPTQFTMADALADASPGEVIAVRKGTPVSNQPQIYDMTYLPVAGAVGSTTLFADDPINQPTVNSNNTITGWDFFTRRILIVNLTNCAISTGVSANCPAVPAGSQPLYYPAYSVTVRVQSLYEGADQSSIRTIFLSDYK